MRRRVGKLSSQRKVSYYDMTTYKPTELKEKYKLDTRGLEYQVRHECRDGSKNDMEAFYKTAYSKNK